ncbi:MAG: DUF4974 domain-containing protein [Chitinophaga sp.]|uniref:FecR family protein n=1 Tax=Chitinophaga sp. TaxID=1869181 RepID=UPI0025BA8753|nr:FecR family protein [Chitinophaga sp.]MBV8252059.1 DUF4974 domain-containing protein [Chitinophaga sp.]
MDDLYAQTLMDRLFRGTITTEEKKVLASWIADPANGTRLEELMEIHWQQQDASHALPDDRAQQMLAAIHAKPVKPLTQRLRIGRAAAAIVLLVSVAGAGYLFFKSSLHQKSPMANVVSHLQPIQAPATVKAVVTLSNGQQISLDSLATGAFATQGNVQLTKSAHDDIAYQLKPGDNDLASGTNTITNPRGSKVATVALSDGSRAWLNAGSSLRYPVAFTGHERKVEMSGEVYFEIAPKAAQPFIVKKTNDGAEIQVLGTHFNVNAFDDEKEMKVTLLEGAVRVKNSGSSKVLTAGQQAVVSSNGDIRLQPDADTEEVMAWKNGLFNFNSLELQEVMRQVSRWYDVEVVYQGNQSNRHFTGIVSRNKDISEVCKLMQLAGIQFKITGKTIVVEQ